MNRAWWNDESPDTCNHFSLEMLPTWLQLPLPPFAMSRHEIPRRVSISLENVEVIVYLLEIEDGEEIQMKRLPPKSSRWMASQDRKVSPTEVAAADGLRLSFSSSGLWARRRRTWEECLKAQPYEQPENEGTLHYVSVAKYSLQNGGGSALLFPKQEVTMLRSFFDMQFSSIFIHFPPAHGKHTLELALCSEIGPAQPKRFSEHIITVAASI